MKSKNKFLSIQTKSYFKFFIVFFVSFFLILVVYTPNQALAVNATQSAKSVPSPTASASGTLAQKINELKEKAASKAADFIAQVTKKLQNKAYFGIISSIDNDTVKISFQNHDFITQTNEYTAYVATGKSAKKIASLKDLSKGDFVSALGDVDEKGVLKAKKLIKSPAVASDSANLVWGQVEKVVGGTITVKLPDTTSQIITSFGKSPIFLGQNEGSLADLKIGRTIIARGKMTSNAGLTSTYIYIVPPSADAKPEKNSESTKSAQIAPATPSAKPVKN
jgi:hypothetical protein